MDTVFDAMMLMWRVLCIVVCCVMLLLSGSTSTLLPMMMMMISSTIRFLIVCTIVKLNVTKTFDMCTLPCTVKMCTNTYNEKENKGKLMCKERRKIKENENNKKIKENRKLVWLRMTQKQYRDCCTMLTEKCHWIEANL